MGEAAEMLNSGRLDAFVGDFPVLNYWTHSNRDKGLRVVGNTFHPEKFGFAVNRGTGDLTERITMALIHLHDDGTTEKLAANYYLEYNGTRLRQ